VARPKGTLPVPDPFLSRLGGDEFTLLLEDIRDPSDAVRVGERIRTVLAASWPEEGRAMLASASIGIALSTSLREASEDLLQEADTAMRRAKALGGSRCEVFDEAMHAQAIHRLQLEAGLRTAIEQQQFQLYYQPIVRLSDREIVGFEALLRWRHPEKGIISADKFINAAEDLGLVVAVGKWVLGEACRQMQAWGTKFPESRLAKMTVNLSAKQLAYPRLSADIKAALEASRLGPACLQAEIAEGTAMADPKLACEAFNELRSLGLQVSLAQFGSGPCSLNWLRRFSADQIKIDRRVVGSVLTDRYSNDVTALTVSMARVLKARVVAEGIESAVQLGQLVALGCDFGQGFLFSHPVTAEKAGELLRQQIKRAMAIK
jgi:EAL domain-containing protein (putative c-di-GMP-specific phosphodiesterase class I)